MKNFLIVALMLSPFFAAAQQVPKSLTASNGVFIGFYEYKPTDYNSNPNTQYPVIIFLHGIGERGDGVTNLPLVLSNGVPQKINLGHNMRFFWNGRWETFLVLSPQLSTNYGDWPTFYVDEMISHAKRNLRIDQSRIYLTGLSLGGGGVWRFASASVSNSNQLAAIAPICGTCAVSSASNIAQSNLPIWAFHAANDPIVGAGCTTSALQNINNNGIQTKPLLTMYPNGGHAIWYMSYDTEYNYHDINLYEWFLGQKRGLGTNILPAARAGVDITINSVLGSANLSASASSDADGSIVRYTWRKIGGPNLGSILSSITTNGLTAITGLLSPGTYTYELKVVDDRGGTSFDTVNVIASLLGGGNQAPVANAGSDQSTTNTSVGLNGSGSYDNDGGVTGWSWAKTGGPAGGAISNTGISNPTVSGLTSGTYQFTLTVRDVHGATSSDAVQIAVNNGGGSNIAPVANAGSSFSITLPTNSASLNGNGSYDSDGSITSFNWSKVGGPTQFTIANSSSASTAISNLAQGTYLFRLSITDNAGGTAADTITVTVNPGVAPAPNSIAPVVKAGNDLTITLPTNNVSVSGWNSYDPDGSIASWNWSKVSGPTEGTIASPSTGATAISGLTQGTYLFRLLVTDNSGTSGADTVKVTVNAGTPPPPPSSTAPVARAGNDISVTLPTNSASINGYGSYDNDGSIIAFNWSKVSGPGASNISNPAAGSTTVTGMTAGVYTFRLQVTDNAGNNSADTMQITVNGTGGTPPAGTYAPIAKAGPNFSITLPTNNISLNGYSSYDPDGQIVGFNWSKISGPTQFSINSASAASTTITNLAQGTYWFKLTVTDNSGATGGDTVVVTVNPGAATGPGSQAPISKAGNDITLSAGSIATLKGYGSYDPDGQIVSYAWSKVSGPAGGNITDPGAGSTTVSSLVQGAYQYKLVVRDNNGITAEDIVAINVYSSTGAAAPTSASLEATVIEENLIIAPNPATTSTTIRVVSEALGQSKMRIYDMSGRLVFSREFTKEAAVFTLPVDVSKYTNGIYQVEIIVDNWKRMVTKFVKQ
ncbi:MAG: T9SS type A sorting domain-containing protein [Chitinophagaceae bacterium]|nr:T9SS type A sorting domain-containing protein [Chitinophagaceae bacterium]